MLLRQDGVATYGVGLQVVELRAVLSAALARPEIKADHDRIYVAGLSHGAILAGLWAAADARLTHVISVGGGYPIRCDAAAWWQPIYWLGDQCRGGKWFFDYYQALKLIFPRHLLLFNAKGDDAGRLTDGQLAQLRALYNGAGLEPRLVTAMDRPLAGPGSPHRFDYPVQQRVWGLTKAWRR